MTYEKALSLYKNDKTLQILRADHFPLLVSFFHLVFKQQDKISYLQSDITSILGDFLFSLDRQGIHDYNKPALEYLQKWAQQGFLRRYYETADEPVYELSPATEHALKWLEDLNKQQFVGTHSRLLQFFTLLQQIVNKTLGPYERIKQLEEERKKIDDEIDQIKQGNFIRPTETQVKEHYFLAEETARRLLADFRQVEENFRELDLQTRQTIIKSDAAKADLLDDIFRRQDYLWNTDQGKSFSAFWEFLMSEQMQGELESLIKQVNSIPAIQEVKREQTVDRIKVNLVEAGDKVNRSNDGLIGQIRKFVEQKNIAESKHILRSIDAIEVLLMDHKDDLDSQAILMEVNTLPRPALFMERPLYSPPVKILFEQTPIENGTANADTHLLFEQFYIDLEVLRRNIKQMLRDKSQVSLTELLQSHRATKGVAEILGYMQIATADKRHLVNHEEQQELSIENTDSNTRYLMKAPLIIFNR